MKKHLYIIIALCVTLVSCGGDDSVPGDTGGGTVTPSAGNINANSTTKSIHAQRLEVPRLQNGNNYQLLVKTDSEIGVNYIIEWDCVNHAQRWTCFHWTKSNTFKNWDRGKWSSGATFNGYGGDYDPFQPDPEISSQFRSELSDYSGSGYNRGHMCASEDRICSKNVNGQTFYLSNMHPQISGHNGGVWSNMESRVRSWRDAAIKAGGELFVCKGGTIYAKGSSMASGTMQDIHATIGSNKLPVPKYFFMAVLKKNSSGTYSGMAFWTEHKTDNSGSLTPYMITIDELEKRTGYDFFCNLPDLQENAVEANLVESEWK